MCCPLGMLLRYFVNFYDMEIIEEEAFLAWKEDITQEFPGKGKALFQVRTPPPPLGLVLGTVHVLTTHSLTHRSPLPPPPHLPPCRSTSGSHGWRRRRRRSRTTTLTDRPHLDLTVARLFCFLVLVGFSLSLVVRKSTLDLPTASVAPSRIPLASRNSRTKSSLCRASRVTPTNPLTPTVTIG